MIKADGADRVRSAQMAGRAARTRNERRLNHDPELQARYRAEWPALWEAIDSLTELIDW